MGLRDHEVRLVEEVLDLLLARLDVVEVLLVAEVGSADQVPPVPRHDKVGPSVLARLDVESLALRGTRESVHDEVAALGAAHEAPDVPVGAWLFEFREHLVDPGTRDVDRYG